MISAFIGSPGSGKSTALAWVARRATTHPNKPITICGETVSKGHTLLFTNFPFDGAYQLDYDNLGKYRYEDALILLDEVSMYSDSRDYKNFSRALTYFYTQHRKFHCDLIWTSQAFDDSDKKIRNVTTSYFMIEPFLFGFSRFVHIKGFTKLIDSKIRSGYEWGKVQYFRTTPLYKLFDSYSTLKIAKESLPPPPLIPWNESENNDTKSEIVTNTNSVDSDDMYIRSDSDFVSLSSSPLSDSFPSDSPPFSSPLFGSFSVDGSFQPGQSD